MNVIDLAKTPLREVNSRLQKLPQDTNERLWKLVNVHGEHACAVGLTQPIEVQIDGHIGYYCGGMNQEATIVVNGQCGVGLAENIMSGEVRVKGNASAAAGATGQGGLIVIEGDAGTRCGISMKGVDIVVAGSVGAMSAFMAQAGSLVVLGDAGEALGDSIYEARLYVRGKVKSLGADCIAKPLEDQHKAELGRLLAAAGVGGEIDPAGFQRYGSARNLYHFHIDNVGSY
jgi:methylamine---glutamate N-methyltransferase subunit B